MTRAIQNITVRGARQHNLKSLDVETPRNRSTVITGLSGSGKPIKIAAQLRIDLAAPFERLTPKAREAVFCGIKERGRRLDGILDVLKRQYDSEGVAEILKPTREAN